MLRLPIGSVNSRAQNWLTPKCPSKVTRRVRILVSSTSASLSNNFPYMVNYRWGAESDTKNGKADGGDLRASRVEGSGVES